MLTFTPEPLRVDISLNGTPIGTVVIENVGRKSVQEAGAVIGKAIDEAAAKICRR